MDYYDDEITIYGLVRDLFVAASVTCFLWALHDIARGLLLGARVKSYDRLEDAYTPEEREVLIHRIKVGSIRR
jgi:hypothetical protein